MFVLFLFHAPPCDIVFSWSIVFTPGEIIPWCHIFTGMKKKSVHLYDRRYILWYFIKKCQSNQRTTSYMTVSGVKQLHAKVSISLPQIYSYERWKSKQPTICWPVFEDTLVLSQWQKLIFMDANGFQDLTWQASLCHYQSSNGHIHTK